MNVEALIILFLIIVGLVWGFWLIFKRDLMQNQIGKLLSYFLGVVVTLLIVMWLVSRFLPWWAVRLVENTQESPSVQELQSVSSDLWNQLSNPNVVIPTQPSQPPATVEPAPGISPVATPADTNTSQSVPVGGTRIHIVQSGDTLYSISRKYGTTVDALKQRNGLTNNTILVGQKLIVP